MEGLISLSKSPLGGSHSLEREVKRLDFREKLILFLSFGVKKKKE